MVVKPASEAQVREATEADAAEVVRVFQAAYGDAYMYPQFYQETGVKKMIFSDDTLMLVAEDEGTGEILGTASVVLEIGAFSDLVGEFGRLVVAPEARGRGIGKKLLRGRLERVRDRLHVGIIEARTAHPYSCMIARRHGFAPVGALPNKLFFGPEREHASLYVQHFGQALALRRNHPRVIPEVYRLASAAMSHVGLDVDVVVDEEAAPYAHGGDYSIEDLEADGYSSLLRIERGRVRRREVFGPLRLHYGFFKLEATQAHYLIARSEGRVAGAVGFILDRHEKHVRIFELIHIDEAAVRSLLTALDRRAREDWDIATIEIDVSADAPRMQRTLLEIGYRPACYLPAHAFHRVERRDVVKMWRLFEAPLPCPPDLPTRASELVDMVLASFRRQRAQPRIREAMERMRLFSGLTEDQAAWLGALIDYRRVDEGEELFRRGQPSDEMYLIVDGEVSIETEAAVLGTVGPGECVGEVALLAGGGHSATAVARRELEAGVLTRVELIELVRRRPDIGVVLYRNLAAELGDKLRRTDFADRDA
ncbi:MAG: GNAT family N-acetyltransferase [Gemmatimonadota bacterium]|nr:GNAT family N-acetyltransferase [Gemmatimonadota bacterium]